MKGKRLVLLSTVAVCLLSAGCGDKLDLENAITPLALGLDLDDEDKFHFYISSPVFSKDIKKKSQEIEGMARTLRQSRAKQGVQSAGIAQGRNYQVLLVGKRMLRHADWFRMLDVLYRDARNTITDRMIAVDGTVSDIMHLTRSDQPLVPILLRGMVDTKSASSETVKTTLWEMHRQMWEKGMTPVLSEVKISQKKITLKGTALLDHKGQYAASLGEQESILLNILKKDAKPGISLTYAFPGKPKTGPFDTNTISFTVNELSTRVKSSYRQDRFRFDIKIKLIVSLSEHLFPYNVSKNSKSLEKKISGLVKAQFEDLMKKIQKHEIDPVGLGLYARAYQYGEYKKVEDHWGKALADANIHISVAIVLRAMGPVK